MEYYPGYYAADVFDPDGYSFEVVHKASDGTTDHHLARDTNRPVKSIHSTKSALEGSLRSLNMAPTEPADSIQPVNTEHDS